MHSALVPSHLLPDLALPEADPRISAALLYFDHLDLFNVTLPLPPDMTDDWARFESVLRSVRGDAIVDIPDPIAATELPPTERIAIATMRYAKNYASFYRAYQPLIDEGVLRFHSLQQAFMGGSEDDSQSSAMELLRMAADIARDGFILRPEIHGLVAQLAAETASTVDNGYSIGLLWSAVTRALGEDSIWRDPGYLAIMIQILELVVAAFLAGSGTYITFHAQYPQASALFAQRISSIVGSDNVPTGSSMAPIEIMSTILATFPAIKARSANAVLELRHDLQAELMELRDRIQDIATDIADAPDSTVSIQAEVERRIHRPVRDLTRRLSRPGRDLARNLFSNQSFLTAAITMAATYASTPPISTATLSLSVPLLASSLQTLFDRKRQIDQSGVAFVMRAIAK